MIKSYRLSELAEVLEGRLLGKDTAISGISIDTRTIAEGNLFIAIEGPRFDGHDFADRAVQAGAVAIVVSRRLYEIDIPQILVSDTGLALGQLGQFNRQHFHSPLVAVTGTCGKTSLKEMLAAIFSQSGETLATRGNLNNAFGVPLTLFELNDQHEYAVVELGTSSPGEIDYISRLAEPDIGVITNAAENHLKDLKTLEGVVYEKGFILDCIKSEGTAILNLDDDSFGHWAERAGQVATRITKSFSLDNPAADVFASDIVSTKRGMTFTLNLKIDGQIQQRSVMLAFWGKHQVQNACCAALAAQATGLTLDNIVLGLENAQPFQRRGSRYSLSEQCLLIDESYNASPIATLAAIDQLADCEGRKLMVLGDMLDLGVVAQARHQDIGRHAREKGIDAFFGYGELTRLSIQSFGGDGRHFSDKNALSNAVEELMALWSQDDSMVPVTVLVKGSRGMEMLDVVRSLVGSEYKGER